MNIVEKIKYKYLGMEPPKTEEWGFYRIRINSIGGRAWVDHNYIRMNKKNKDLIDNWHGCKVCNMPFQTWPTNNEQGPFLCWKCDNIEDKEYEEIVEETQREILNKHGKKKLSKKEKVAAVSQWLAGSI